MKFTIGRKSLSDSLTPIARIVPTASPLPIMLNVAMDARDGHISLLGGEADFQIRVVAEANVLRPGSLTVPAKRLLGLINAFPDAEMAFDASENQLAIKCIGCQYKLAGIGIEEYPTSSVASPKWEFDLPGNAFGRMLRRVLFAAADDKGDGRFRGVRIMCGDEVLSTTATDTYILARARMRLNGCPDFNANVPQKLLAEMEKHLPEEFDDSVTIRISDSQLSISAHNVVAVSALYDAAYPDIDKIIPKMEGDCAVVDREKMVSALKRARMIAGDSDFKDRIDILVKDSEIEMSAVASQGLGHAREVFEIERDGEDADFSLSGNYLQAALSAVGGDRLALYYQLATSRNGRAFVAPPEDTNYQIMICAMVRMEKVE